MATERHKGYKTVNLLITAGQIQFREIFEHIPKSVLVNDLGINFYRLNKIMRLVTEIKLDELYGLARLIGVDEKVLVDLAHAQYLADKKKKK